MVTLKDECTVKPFDVTLESNSILNSRRQLISDWHEVTTKFVAKATDHQLRLTFFEELKTDITTSTGGQALDIDDITFKGPFEYVSEEKQLNNSCGCSYGNILRWKNNLGGWDSLGFSK